MRKGFTLVELLIVLAVIAALMAVATPLALNAVKNAKASQVAQNFRNIKAAVENYINTEKQTSVSLGVLEGSYLSKAPDNFSVTSQTTGNGGILVTITYTGGDVDVSKVQNVYPDVTSSTSGLQLSFTIQKWW